MTPDQNTIEERRIKVGDSHELYAQSWGNKNAEETIIFLHGGPGSGCTDDHKDLFNPRVHKVIFFDQRGCGNSTPRGLLRANNTDALAEDITKVAEAFGVDDFTLAGGSWGSCLALVYAIRNPKRVRRMVLRGIFTGRQSEIEFLEKGQFRSFFPEVWEDFAQSAPEKFRSNPRAFHIPRVLGKDKAAAKRSAFAYNLLEGSILRLDDRTRPQDFATFDPFPTIIECHFMANNCFLPANHIMKNAHKITAPVDLIQGRYDAICPPITAFELAQKLPNARLFWTTAGHSGNDRANWDLVRSLLA